MNRKILLIGLACAVAIMALVSGYLYARQTPRYSLYQLKKALLARDMEAINFYADLDGIADKMVERIFAKATGGNDRQEESGGRGNRLKDMLREYLPSVKRDFKEQSKKQLLSYLDDEKWRQALESTSVWMLTIEEEGNSARVLIDKKPRFFVTRVAEGHWRITEIVFNDKK